MDISPQLHHQRQSTLEAHLGQNLDILATLLHSHLLMALGAKPVRLLPPLLTIRERPPKDIHKFSHSIAAALDLCLCRLAALGALDPLRQRAEPIQGDGWLGLLCVCGLVRQGVLLAGCC